MENTDKRGFMTADWHSLEIEDVLARLGSTREGLSSEEAAKRLQRFGFNELEEAKRISRLEIFISQFKNILIIVLIVAAVLSGLIGDIVEAIVIGVIVVFAALLGFVQEYRAEEAIAALRRMAAPRARVLRDGKPREIPAREVVPGDILVLETGDKVAADARLLEVFNLKTDEAVLTGESTQVGKTTEPLKGELGLGDQRNMVFGGTIVTYGRGRGVVVATGMETEFGKIAGMLQEVEERQTPLQENLDSLSRVLLKITLVVVVLIAGAGMVAWDASPLEMFVWGVALAVAVVPEALPAVVVISLAIGVQRMVKRHALIRKLPAVETLGSVSVICTDKTGTLTRNEMTVRNIYLDRREIQVTGAGYTPQGEFLLEGRPYASPDLELLLRIGLHCNDAHLEDSKGDPTEVALLVAASKAGLKKQGEPRIAEIPFTSERKMMTTIHPGIAYSKGAPEAILPRCSRIRLEGREKNLGEEEREEILEKVGEMAGRALRVLALAYKPLEDKPLEDGPESLEDIERDMVFVGLVGMLDPPREEAKEAIRKCERAGIKVIMITGDHKLTAQAVAAELGLYKGGVILTGAELDSLEEKEFEELAEDVEVYARVSPHHKLRVVGALTRKGKVVAMTGDGVNDAPALKKADVGIAMGITGTDVTREAADMILTDDNFSSIVAAVEEGRAIFGNIKKYLLYLLSINFGEVLLIALAIPTRSLPLLAVQILYINLATNGLPALALSVDPPDPDLMEQPPRNPRKSIFTRRVTALMAAGGIWLGLLTFTVFQLAQNNGKSLQEAQSLVFVTLVLTDFCMVFNFRSDHLSILKIGLFKNKWLNYAITWETILLLAVVSLPPLQRAFKTYTLPLEDWAIALLAALTIFPVLEMVKLAIRKGWIKEGQS